MIPQCNTSTWTTVTYRRRPAETGKIEILSPRESNLPSYETSYEGSFFTKDKRYATHCSVSGYKRQGNHSTKTASHSPTRDRTGRRLYMKKGVRKGNAAG